jgi:hypothetical protein
MRKMEIKTKASTVYSLDNYTTGLLVDVILAPFQPEAAVTSLTPIDFVEQAIPEFFRRQRIGNGLPTETHEIWGQS